MKRYTFLVAASTLGMLLSGCGGLTNGQSYVPPASQVNTKTSGKLEFAIGTANIAADGQIGLNVVATLRQADGDSAFLVDTPSIVGPSGFTVQAPAMRVSPSGNSVIDAGSDSGTNTISGNPQEPNPTTTPIPDTLGPTGGVFDNGFGPFNLSNDPDEAFYAGAPDQNPNPPYQEIGADYAQPFYGAFSTQQIYLGGPPQYPFIYNGQYPSDFAGWPQGWIAFETPPVAGAYTLNVVVAAANAPSATYTSSSTLANLTPLPSIPTPTFAEDGAGGGSGTVNVGNDSRIVETMVYILDQSTGNFYTVQPAGTTGILTFALPDELGTCSTPVSGCQNVASSQAPTLNAGDTYEVYAVSYDWPMFEAEPPGNTSQTPTITASLNGQADVSLSPALKAVY